jgi:hypothetical protein
MKAWFGRSVRWGRVIVVTVSICVVLGRGATPPQDRRAQLNLLTMGRTFNFVSWEVSALLQKALYGALAPHRYMDDEAQSRFVLAYLDNVRSSRSLSGEIDRFYTDPMIEDPALASAEIREQFSALRREMARQAPIAEAILEWQVSHVLADGGLGGLSAILPPVQGTFTPLPTILVVSPRETVQSLYQQQLVAGLTAAEQDEIETMVMERLPEVSAYVTEIGGLAAYPAMLLESGSIEWVTDVMAHEWAHHYLTFFPLGWYYMRDGETRTINETTATLIGEWAGQQVMLHYYEPLFAQDKPLPAGIVSDETEVSSGPPVFDFREEMHRTRVNVDRLLAEGKVNEAEWYMELQRRYFVANGYRIRRLNQAYFAFHGAYASAPGAAGEDPIGPLVRRLWALSSTPADFLRRIASITSLQALETVVESELLPSQSLTTM